MSANETQTPDLSEWDEVFEQAVPEERSIEEVPDGKYQAKINKVILKSSKTSNNPMLSWDLIVLAGPYKGRHVFRNSVITSPDTVKWLKTDLHTCGLDIAKISELQSPETLARLLDVCVDIQVKTNGDFKNVYLNRRIQVAGGVAAGGAEAGGFNPEGAPWA